MKCVKFRASRTAFTRLELMAITVVCCLLAIPVFISATHRVAARSQRINCTKNLQQIGLVFKTCALDHEDKFPMQALGQPGTSTNNIESVEVFRYFQVMSNDLANPKVLICPTDTRLPSADLANDFSNSNLSYFLGLDAMDTNPQMFLTGDRNLTNGPLPSNRILVPNTNYPAGWTAEMHHYQGNIGLADGSVQQLARNRLTEALRNTSYTNRLAMP